LHIFSETKGSHFQKKLSAPSRLPRASNFKIEGNEKYNVKSSNMNTYLTRILSLNGSNLLNSLVPCGELNAVCCFYLGLSRPNDEIVEYEIDNCENEKSYY